MYIENFLGGYWPTNREILGGGTPFPSVPMVKLSGFRCWRYMPNIIDHKFLESIFQKENEEAGIPFYHWLMEQTI